MSSPEFSEMRGIPGSAVAAKAQLYSCSRIRRLLFFLQALSLRGCGLQKVARELDISHHDEEEVGPFLTEFCINPKIAIDLSDHSIGQALVTYQDRYEAGVQAKSITTTIGRQIIETLDHGLALGKMVVIEGDSGSGKTTAAKAWCDQYLGEVRYVSLSGITQKTGFFQRLASAIGLAASKRKAIDMQIKVEDFFRRTRLMLVIDEAHYLFPQHLDRHATPALVDWVNTALLNDQVPVALICTDQFAKLKAGIEKRTGWTSEQLEHRVKRYVKLPSTPTKEDLEAVAAKLLAMRWDANESRWGRPGNRAPVDFVNMVVGYALTCKMRLPAVADAIEEARCLARRSGRSKLVAADLRSAILEHCIPSNQALARAFEPTGSRGTTGAARLHAAARSGLQQRCNGVANVLR